eukprot:TRINITY_DN6611_c0_g2_i4.p1 TRINITY_DN6611_c0_g2~~TRINITY_DN6611_c0_g2_i4.p1  ORF type:complete len:225 (+),score=51.54 TRINITY_DN6611_c0_g2_i4:73-747(+)
MEENFEPGLFLNTDYTVEKWEYKGVEEEVYCLKSAQTDFDLTGQVIWKAAYFLSEYIVDNQELFKDKTILELGAGVGLCGLVAAHFAQTIVLTDHHDVVLDLLRRNITQSARDKVFTGKLDWGKTSLADLNATNHKDEAHELKNLDFIIGADIVFWPDSIAPLYITLREVKAAFPRCRIIISAYSRSALSDKLFLSKAKEFGFNVSVIKGAEMINIYELETIEA